MYCLTSFGFGLNTAPKITVTTLKTVLGKNNKIIGVTDTYIDDIMIEVNQVGDHIKTSQWAEVVEYIDCISAEK